MRRRNHCPRRSSAAAARARRTRCSDRSDRCARRSRSCTHPCTAPSGTTSRHPSSGRFRAPRSGRTDAPVRRRTAGSGSLRVDVDHRDHLAVAQAEMRPRLSRIRRFVDAVAHGEIGPDDPRAAAHVDDVRIGRRDGNRADRASGLRHRRAAPRWTRSPSIATRRRYRSPRRRRWAELGTPARARARPARVGPIERQCMADETSADCAERAHAEPATNGGRGGSDEP